jgi:hypothetical protein
VSHSLKMLWNHREKRTTPARQNLADVVLEDDTFDNLDFSDADLRTAILYKASFKNCIFRGANFKDTLVQDVWLDGADRSGVTRVSGSVWQGTTYWWDAKCVSPERLEYLMGNDPSSGTKTPKTNCP